MGKQGKGKNSQIERTVWTATPRLREAKSRLWKTNEVVWIKSETGKRKNREGDSLKNIKID